LTVRVARTQFPRAGDGGDAQESSRKLKGSPAHAMDAVLSTPKDSLAISSLE